MPDRPTRFKRPVLLIVGCGDIGLRVARLRRRSLARPGADIEPVARRRRCARQESGRCAAISTIRRRWRASPDWPMRCCISRRRAPPAPPTCARRTCCARSRRSPRLARIVYASTTGVYGDRAGARTDETAPLRPATDRARRRVDAEERLRRFGRATGVAVSLLRVPGIYALDRPGGDPRERVARGTPVLAAADDVYTGHIHADDLARACVAALARGEAAARGQRRRRHRAPDGRLLRSRRGPLRPGAPAAPRRAPTRPPSSRRCR